MNLNLTTTRNDMNKYSATFSDGSTETRGSKREYTHAWKLFKGENTVKYGFSASEEKAVKAGAGYKGYYKDVVGYADGAFRVEVVAITN